MVQLLMAATLVISRLASPVFPLSSSHLADSRMHLKMTERRLSATLDLDSRCWPVKTRENTPYINSDHPVESSCDELSQSPVSDEVDHASEDALSQRAAQLSHARPPRPLGHPDPLRGWKGQRVSKATEARRSFRSHSRSHPGTRAGLISKLRAIVGGTWPSVSREESQHEWQG